MAKEEKKNQWLSVTDLIEILQTMPKDAKVIIDNNNTFENGCYYVTRDSIELYKDGSYEEYQVMIGTNYNTIALGFE